MLAALTLCRFADGVKMGLMTGAYHHGDLRPTLIAAGGEALEEVGYEALSLRRLSEAAGVSTAAPYRHFANREALLLTLAMQGGEALEESYRVAVQSDATPKQRLRGVFEAYVGLAVQRPQLFRLMFVSDVVVAREPAPQWRQSADRAYQLFQTAVSDAFPDLDPDAAARHAAFCWVSLHGVALMAIHGRLHRFTRDGEPEGSFIASILDTLIDGHMPSARESRASENVMLLDRASEGRGRR